MSKLTRRTALTTTAAGAVAAATPVVASAGTSTPGPNDRRLWELVGQIDAAMEADDIPRSQALDRALRQTPADTPSGMLAKLRGYFLDEPLPSEDKDTPHALDGTELLASVVRDIQRQAGEAAGTTPAAGAAAQDPDEPIHDLADRWWRLEHELEAFDGEVPDGDTRAHEQGEIARVLADKKAVTVAGARRKAEVKLKSGCAGRYERLGDSALADLTRLGEAA